MCETVDAVFEVHTNGKGPFYPKVKCVILYAVLRNGITRGAALPKMTEYVKEHWRAKTIEFKFWCDGYSANGGAPVEF